MYLPKITVIVAVFNGSATLSRCIKSIHSQSYLNKELIIMDGGSTDNTVKIIEENSHGIAYWESKTDRGIYHAWNKALSFSSGEWVCFLGSDDFLWQDDVLDKVVPMLEIAKNKDIRLVYGRVASINKAGKVQNIFGSPWDKTTSIAAHQMPPHPGLLHHSDIFKDHGRFDESYRIAGDYEFLLRELTTRDAMFMSEIIVAGVQYGGVSCNIKYLTQLIKEDILARKTNGLKPLTRGALKYYTVLLFNSLTHHFIKAS
jgi:hypothetical protein